MRTTPNIDDDVLEAARSIAGERNLSVGAVLSELARRGLHRSETDRRRQKGFPVFEVSNDSTPLTLDHVERYRDMP
ncbi:MAG: hypothetical protein F4114_10940 [Rhodospirillaceae bacterium]|nr:hypothetical protein [Rhodospirillaceae bacterium]MYB14134.1 hypothetical protein [Rhodospirillaceae bacterium]MYI49587.1 hypothetical protein [Rhodospirillaceae bacterium]